MWNFDVHEAVVLPSKACVKDSFSNDGDGSFCDDGVSFKFSPVISFTVIKGGVLKDILFGRCHANELLCDTAARRKLSS